MDTGGHFSDDYGPHRLSVELANICNLHCSYCFRSEDNLYSHHAEFFPLPLLCRVLDEARPYFQYFPYREAMPARFLQGA